LLLELSVKGSVEPGNSLNMKNRRFTYNEVKAMTKNFQLELGEGSFGKVYNGFLKDGTRVAVKLLSECSRQGVGEFLAEVICTCFTKSIRYTNNEGSLQINWEVLVNYFLLLRLRP
jgi:hypothetical protein